MVRDEFSTASARWALPFSCNQACRRWRGSPAVIGGASACGARALAPEDCGSGGRLPALLARSRLKRDGAEGGGGGAAGGGGPVGAQVVARVPGLRKAPRNVPPQARSGQSRRGPPGLARWVAGVRPAPGAPGRSPGGSGVAANIADL